MIRLFLGLLAAICVPALILTIGEYTSLRQFGFEYSALISGAARIAILTFATFFGITSQILIARLKRLKSDTISIISELSAATSSRDFWIAIFASPLVLAAAYSAIEQVTSLLLVATIGFQNGYFFHSLLNRKSAG